MKLWLLLLGLLISHWSCNRGYPKINDTISMKSHLTITWGREKAQISPKYIPSGLALEETPTTQLAPFLFQVDAELNTYIIDANFSQLTIFDEKKSFRQKLELPDILKALSIVNFECYKPHYCAILANDQGNSYYLIDWNLTTNTTQKIALGDYRGAQLIYPRKAAPSTLYCWTENDDYTGQLWSFSTQDLNQHNKKNLPFIASRLFYWNHKIVGIKYFDQLNKRGLELVDLNSTVSQEIVCSKQLYGSLLYPIGMDDNGNLFTYGLPTEDQPYGIIYTISKDGILQDKNSLHETLNLNKLKGGELTPYNMWKVLSNGTILLGVMTEKELSVLKVHLPN